MKTVKKTFGYSLLEVIVVVFMMAGMLLAALSVFETGERGTAKLERGMIALRLAQQISEELHSKKSSDIADKTGEIPFGPPFSSYLYTVQKSTFNDSSSSIRVGNLWKISVTAKGPLDNKHQSTPQTTSVSLWMLLARQPYP